MTKDEIRVTKRRQRDELSKKEQEQLGVLIRDRLFQSEEYRKSNSVFTYVSFRNEVDTKIIINQSLKDHKKVFVPRVEQERMNFYEIKSINELSPSSMGILEPTGKNELRYQNKEQGEAQENLLMLLPGLAFDYKGNRIGYGAGYYDRYLSEVGVERFNKIALGYDFQMEEGIIFDKFDIKVDGIITPTGYIDCHKVL